MRQPKLIEHVLHQSNPRKRIRLVDFIGDFRQVRAAFHQLAPHIISRGPRARILEGARIGRDRREKAISYLGSHRPIGAIQQPIDQLAGGWRARSNPIDVRVTRVAFVMINIDENSAIPDQFACGAKPLKTGAVGRNHTIERRVVFRVRQQLIRIQERQLARHWVLVPAGDLLALVPQSDREAKLRANAITVWPDVPNHANRIAGANLIQDPLNNPGRLHPSAGKLFSSSARISSTRLPRTTESSTTKRS